MEIGMSMYICNMEFRVSNEMCGGWHCEGVLCISVLEYAGILP